jgi:hypothetical protein
MKNFVGIAAFVIIASIVFTASSQTITVGLYSDPQGTECDWFLSPGAWVDLYVVITGSELACLTGVQFAAPVPPCARGKLIWLGDSTPFPVTLGDSQTGIAIGFGTYYYTPITALRMSYYVADANLDLCDLPVLPAPYETSGQVLVTDCAFNLIPAQGHGVGLSYCVADMPPPYNLSPSDGATDVSLDPVLSWESWMPDVCGEGMLGCYPTHQVYFGTTPNPPKVLYDYSHFTWTPGPLQPAMTYYWRVVHLTWMSTHAGSSPEMSFTTIGSVATRDPNWGSIKALYDEGNENK